MAGGYTRKNELLRGSAVSVGASASNTVVSNTFTLSAAESLNFLAQVQCSAIVAGTGVTAKLQHSPDGTNWVDVGSSAQAASVSKSFDCGVAESSTITWPATAGATQADYVHFTAQDGTKYAIWLDIDANGTAPTGALYTAADVQIEVDIVTGGTAANNATLAKTAISTLMDADFSITDNLDGTWTAAQVNTGAVTDPVPKSANDGGAGSIVVAVDTAGSNGDISVANDTITETSHGWSTGDAVYVTGSDLPAGLTTATVYYIIRVDANSYKLATSNENALAGTAVNLTDFGSSTGTSAGTNFTIRMLATDSTDVAQLPLWDVCRVVMDSGAGDSATVSAVYRAARL